MGNPVVHFEILGKDVSRLRAFYAEMFGWKIDANNPMNYGMISREGNVAPDGSGIGGGIGPVEGDAQGHVTVYVQVDDVAKALAAVENLGGSPIMGPMKMEMGPTLGLFADPEGHVIGLVENFS